MKELGRHGRLGYLTDGQLKPLLEDVVAAINEFKIASIAATLSTAQYDKHLAALYDKRKVMGVYGACFLLAIRTCDA